MSEKSCCFSGHRNIAKSSLPHLKHKLRTEITRLISLGVSRFICGGATGFDTISALAVLELKSTFPEILLILFLPCHEQTNFWSAHDKLVYDRILSRADIVHYVSDNYYQGCMLARNKAMVNSSQYLISYLSKREGGTYFTVKYAEEKGLNIIML